MNVAGWTIENNRTAGALFLLIFLAGLSAFFTVSRREDPEFTIRLAVVSTSFPGASPEKVEQLVTNKIEGKVREMGEVKTVTSQSLTGMSLVMVEVKSKYFDMQPIWTDLRNKIEDIKPELPEGIYGPYVDDEFGDVFPVVASITGDGYSYRELKEVADDTRDRLLKLPEVAKVEIYGEQEERIYVEFSNSRLAEMGFSPLELAQTLSSQNVLQPGGSAVVGPERITLESSGAFESVDGIRNVSFRVPTQSEAVYLKDIAKVRRGFVDPPSTLTRFNGESCLMLAASMVPGGKVTDMGEAVKSTIANIQAEQPVGIDCNIFVYQPRYVNRAINNFTANLGQAFFFVVVVMLLFCGLRMGLIAGALVPMAMLLCIALMPAFDIQLQTVSIASLIIALGMLVDNGVVTSENILVRIAQGEERLAACKGAVSELWLPLLAASLTTICAFLPIAIAKSDVAEFCLSLFQVVSITLLSSWILSITFVPLLCYYFLRPKKTRHDYSGTLYRNYRNLLNFSLRHRLIFIALLVGTLWAALWAFQFVPSIFFPPNSREMMLVDFWQPYGTDIRTTRERVAQLEEFLMDDSEVVSVGTIVGEGGPRWMLSLNIEQENPNYASLIINTKTKEGVAGLMARTRTHLADYFPDCRYTVKELETGPPVGAPIKIRISGKNIDTIYALRDKITTAIDNVPGVVNIRDDWGEWIKTLDVNVNQAAAKRAGFSSQDVAISLQSQLSGLQVTQYREDDKVVPVIMRSKEAVRKNLGKIEDVHVYSYATAKSLPLLQLASTRLAWQPSNIRRRETVRTMEIQTDVIGRFASNVLADVIPLVKALEDSQDWVPGYEIEFAGEDAESAEAQASINAGLPLAMGLLAFVLIAQFNSIRRPLIIAFTIPPMLIGITVGLLLTNSPFGFMAFLGMISLMGIIVNNAIMMIDRIEFERQVGQTLTDAVVVAAQRRLRPILMTAITTIVGLLPLSITGGAMWRPMANTIIFGLAFATVLTLLLCPVLYSIFFRISFRDYQWNPAVLEKGD